MNKKWLFSVVFLALVLPSLRIFAMEDEATEEDSAGVVETPEKAPIIGGLLKNVELMQWDGLRSPDGKLEAKCIYKVNPHSEVVCFLTKEEIDRWANECSYPWLCHILIRRTEGDEEVTGIISIEHVTLRAMQWQSNNQLRILCASLVSKRTLQWFDFLYSPDGSWVGSGLKAQAPAK